MKFNQRILAVLFVLPIVLFFSCKPKTKEVSALTEAVFSEEVAQFVNYVTSGNILPGQELRIEFVDDQITEDLVGTEAEDDIMKISPKLPGKLVWGSTRKLSFKPTEKWDMRQYYEVEINLGKLSEELASSELKFGFYVEGQEIEQFRGDVVLKNRNDPKVLKYIGKIAFKLPIEEDDLKKGFEIKKGGKQLKFTLKNTGDNKVYTFESSDIGRGSKSVNYNVKVSKAKLGLEDDYTDNFEVTPVQKMLVKQVTTEEKGRHPRIRVLFSDDLDTEQDINALFSVDPEVKLKVMKSGNTVILDGAFKYGNSYKLKIKPGINSRWATKLERTSNHQLTFSDLEPKIEFASDGIIMPTSNKNKLQFMSSNVERVHIQVKKVFYNKISDFIRSEEISGAKDRKNGFTRNYGGQIGVILLNKTLEIGDTKNEWLLNEIDLSSIIDDNSEGLYLVRLNFNPRDMLVAASEDELDYIADNGSVYKPLVVSNLGITAKKEGDDYHVFVTDLISSNPVSGATVKLYRYWDSEYASGTTNSSGHVELDSDYGVRFISAEKNGQVSYLKLDNMQWNTSGFDISGHSGSYSGQRSFVYTERGVYRPGDEINLSVIVRNGNNTFPDNHPAQLTLYNPDNQNVLKLVNNTAKNGFYTFKFKTKDTDPTGNWEARISAGSNNIYHTIKIETVVPFKLKVRMESDSKKITTRDNKFDLNVRSNYLFGTPAAGLRYDTEVEVRARRVSFPKYQNFDFNNKYTSFSGYNRKISEGELDSSGVAKVSWILPQFEEVSSGLTARFITTVYEKGGRQNTNRISVPIDNYDHYVGVEKPSYWYHYVTTNEESSLQVVCLDAKGTPKSGKKLLYRIYRNNSHWWYHYNSRSEYQRRYKTDNNTTLVKEGSINSGTKPVNLKFTPREDGDYMIEIQEGGYEGHKVTQFVYAYAWGSVPSGDQNAGTLIMKADKAKYNLGDVATVSFPAPKEGSILYTLECENEILDWKWVKPNVEPGKDMQLKIPITEEMVPNAYLTLSVIQPHAQTQNDRPMRMFGILPIYAEDPSTRRDIEIIAPKELKPNKPFSVTVQTKDQRPAQFTIAVVDEGLLDLTGFRTPNPWRNFFKKLRLNVPTYDLFSQIIGVNKGDIFKAFSIGGGMDDFRSQQLNPRKSKRRFKPVSMFKGPISTDNSGKATVKFDMPDYNGSVRIMVVAAREHSYGHAEKTVPVRTDLMVQPSIPRVLGPNEEFTIPVSVFAMKDNVGKVKVNLKLSGPLQVVNSSSKEVNFTRATDKEVLFRVKTKNAVGQAKIQVTASSAKVSATSKTDISVRPSSPRQYETQSKKISRGANASYQVPNKGIAGTNTANISVQLFPNLNFDHRLNWLIRYPYGCVEQTTSSVFPQLYLKTFVKDERDEHQRIDKNIDAGIDRLLRFQTPSGGMAYWPGNDQVSHWSSIYVAHFLTEAKEQGYFVPAGFYDNLISYLKRRSRYGNGGNFERVYRVYVLSRTDENINSELNSLRQDKFDDMSDVQKHMLAAAYYNSGKQETATEILEHANKEYQEYDDFTNHFGSIYRDMGAVLSCLVDMEEKEEARLVAEELARHISSKDWYSTHSLSYMLLSLGRYFNMIGLGELDSQGISGYYLVDGKKVPFGPIHSFKAQINSAVGKELKVFVDGASKSELAYVDVSWSGVPTMDDRPAKAQRLDLSVEWYNEHGNQINPEVSSQATTLYGHFKVSKKASIRYIKELALVQILPSGWEIENMRLSGDQLPEWTSSWNLNQEDYLDIRDDRIMWFFDLGNKPLDFVVKVNVITQGNYYMPPTICEAMYNNNYSALVPGRKVRVVGMR